MISRILRTFGYNELLPGPQKFVIARFYCTFSLSMNEILDRKMANVVELRDVSTDVFAFHNIYVENLNFES